MKFMKHRLIALIQIVGIYVWSYSRIYHANFMARMSRKDVRQAFKSYVFNNDIGSALSYSATCLISAGSKGSINVAEQQCSIKNLTNLTRIGQSEGFSRGGISLAKAGKYLKQAHDILVYEQSWERAVTEGFLGACDELYIFSQHISIGQSYVRDCVAQLLEATEIVGCIVQASSAGENLILAGEALIKGGVAIETEGKEVSSEEIWQLIGDDLQQAGQAMAKAGQDIRLLGVSLRDGTLK